MGAGGGRLEPAEVEVAVDVDVFVHGRREVGEVLVGDGLPLGGELPTSVRPLPSFSTEIYCSA
jgi:hypothetical protein